MTPYLTITAADLSTGLYLSVPQLESRLAEKYAAGEITQALKESTIRNYLDTGRFTRYKLEHTTTVFIALSEVEAWEAKRGDK